MRWLVGMVAVLAVGCVDSHETNVPTHDEVLERTSTPVLLLPPRFMDVATVTSAERWYAIDYEDESITIHLHGTTAFVERPADVNLDEVEHNIQIRGQGGFDVVEEDIRVISWMENGAAYSVDLICRSPIDQRCAKSEFAAEITDQLEAR